MSLETREERREEGLLILPVGRIDSNTSSELEKSLVARGGEKHLVVDLSGVEYVSSAGLRVFLMLARKVKASGGKLALCGLPPSVKQVFDLAGFTALFAVEGTADQAFARLSA
jgi:anti-sigma B factor antagonist